MNDFSLLIDGKAHAGSGAFGVINPATGQVFAQCPRADEALVNAAVAAAKAAFSNWARTPAAERARLVHALADALESRSDEFARLLTAEQGKPLGQAHYEMMASVGTLRTFADMTIEPRTLRDDANGTVIEHRTPLGVVAAITPWNFPVILLMNKVGPALVAGNTMVVKPAPTTPLTTLLFGELCRDILPAGVINIICDENDLGGLLTSHPDIAKVAFTGSTATGRKVMQSAATGIKRVTLELGGNDAAIVLDDVDVQEVAGKVFHGAMLNAGQICVAVKRAYVPAALYDPFCDELARLAEAMVVDEGTRQGAEIGPVQNRAQYEKVKEFLADASANGKVIAGGEALDRPGYFIAPTIVRDLPRDARIVQEEQFGPVLPVLAYDDLDSLIDEVNASDYGLAGTVWGQDRQRALAVAMQIDSGTVWVNQHMAIDPSIPFRGSKQSGLGGELGEAGLHEYTQAHIVNMAA